MAKHEQVIESEIQKWLQFHKHEPFLGSQILGVPRPDLKNKPCKVVGHEKLSIFVGTRFWRGGVEGCSKPDLVVLGGVI